MELHQVKFKKEPVEVRKKENISSLCSMPRQSIWNHFYERMELEVEVEWTNQTVITGGNTIKLG